ncbi:MAG: L,D-transpeptidase [Lachnospiraceae bacterium]|jgi:lipoprotein-anchoring transpeptidase ErfK/SrfK|nr:L,D-transpeptidase [Lachnospiraceae bacterium]MCI6330621.1 L,D-transpeptidase [Lachnospiraceae bacterium]MCI6408793.1 L,D-transpeptidase [Lachnospiraceae bacterium]MCI6978927.1 L,D-transpeptidase [Lachnospiraceae bacterium]MDD6579720.1 L,D-transpeptidase [Lachnospiraceae bacterium]
MSIKIKKGILAVIIFLTAFIYSEDVYAVDYETALQLQQIANENYYAVLNQQQAAANAMAQAALNNQQMILDTIAAKQAAEMKLRQDAQKALEAQQQAALKAQQSAMEAALKAQQSATEAATAIQLASLTTPQVDVVCDTNCSEQNAMLYGKFYPDFVLVDLSEQRAIFYKNGMRVLADNCVTGDAKKGYHTTVGIHQITFKDTNRTLKGSYGEAFVKYWMRFTAGGQGLHDAGWRRNFGSQIYVSNGSHGCVNLPRETAATIFANSYVGMPVIVEN